jgi:uncharacterized protein (DUF2126 family)
MSQGATPARILASRARGARMSAGEEDSLLDKIRGWTATFVALLGAVLAIGITAARTYVYEKVDKPDSNIKHSKDRQVHRPVVMIVADDGRLGLHCTVDNQSWLLPSATGDAASTGSPRTSDRRFAHRADCGVAAITSPSLGHFADTYVR